MIFQTNSYFGCLKRNYFCNTNFRKRFYKPFKPSLSNLSRKEIESMILTLLLANKMKIEYNILYTNFIPITIGASLQLFEKHQSK